MLLHIASLCRLLFCPSRYCVVSRTADDIAVGMRRTLPTDGSRRRVGGGDTELIVVAGRPFKVIEQTPEVVAANIKAFIDGFHYGAQLMKESQKN